MIRSLSFLTGEHDGSRRASFDRRHYVVSRIPARVDHNCLRVSIVSERQRRERYADPMTGAE